MGRLELPDAAAAAHQAEGHMPIAATANTGIEHAADGVESFARERPGAADCAGTVLIGAAYISPVQPVPGEARHHAMRPVAGGKINQVRIELDKRMVLQLMDGLFRPTHLRHVKIAIDGGAVLPTGGKVSDAYVDEVLFVPEFVPSTKLHIGGGGYFKRPIAIRQFASMDGNLRETFEMTPAFQEKTPPAIPSARVGIDQRDVQNRAVPRLAWTARRRRDLGPCRRRPPAID